MILSEAGEGSGGVRKRKMEATEAAKMKQKREVAFETFAWPAERLNSSDLIQHKHRVSAAMPRGVAGGLVEFKIKGRGVELAHKNAATVDGGCQIYSSKERKEAS